MNLNTVMSERQPSPSVNEALGLDPRVSRLASFLVQLQAYQLGDREDVEFPIEGTTRVLTSLPEKDEARLMEKEVRKTLTELCAGDEQLVLDVRDFYLFRFFDERGLWPVGGEHQ